MVNKILRKIFGYEIIKSSKIPSITKSADAIVKAEMLEDSVVKLRNELDASVAKYPIVDTGIRDPSPADTDKRAIYVATVAGFHKDYLKPKILQMISVSNDLLGEIGNEIELDHILKGSIYAFKELDRWGDSMVAEQVGFQTGNNPDRAGWFSNWKQS